MHPCEYQGILPMRWHELGRGQQSCRAINVCRRRCGEFVKEWVGEARPQNKRSKIRVSSIVITIGVHHNNGAKTQSAFVGDQGKHILKNLSKGIRPGISSRPHGRILLLIGGKSPGVVVGLLANPICHYYQNAFIAAPSQCVPAESSPVIATRGRDSTSRVAVDGEKISTWEEGQVM